MKKKFKGKKKTIITKPAKTEKKVEKVVEEVKESQKDKDTKISSSSILGKRRAT